MSLYKIASTQNTRIPSISGHLLARSEEMLLLLGALQTSAWLVGGMAPVPATRGVTRSSSSLRMAVEAEYDLVIVGCGGALPQHESCP